MKRLAMIPALAAFLLVAAWSPAFSGGGHAAALGKPGDPGKVTISHGPIEHLGMPTNMTMVFRVKDPSMLDRLKVGDKINFVAGKVDGAYTVMSFEPSK